MVPALPLIAIGVAAAAVAGWAGATLWARHREEIPQKGSDTGAAWKPRRPASGARPLVWCPACRTYFVAGDKPHECEAAGDRRNGSGSRA
jgi:hypothetical protein